MSVSFTARSKGWRIPSMPEDVLAETIKPAQSLTDYRLHAKVLMQQLPGLRIVWIPRARNSEADTLAELAFAEQIHDSAHGDVMNLSGKKEVLENPL